MLPANILESRRGRLLAFSLLYLTEGIPFGFSAIALTTYLRQAGVGLAEIGLFTASLYAPWGFKPLWAPLVDLINLRRFGHFRFWIFSAQSLMILTLALVMIVDPGTNLRLLTLLIIIHNIFAATQDIAIDALAVSVLPEGERGLANGFMFGSSYIGQAVAGTGAAVFMGLTSPLVAATQFSGYMALRNLMYSYSSTWQGQHANAFGYAATLRLDAWIAFLPLLLIPFLKPSKRWLSEISLGNG